MESSDTFIDLQYIAEISNYYDSTELFTLRDDRQFMNVLQFTAKTGKLCTKLKYLIKLIIHKILFIASKLRAHRSQVGHTTSLSKQNESVSSPKPFPKEIDVKLRKVLLAISLWTAPPFTLQRLCEILVEQSTLIYQGELDRYDVPVGPSLLSLHKISSHLPSTVTPFLPNPNRTISIRRLVSESDDHSHPHAAEGHPSHDSSKSKTDHHLSDANRRPYKVIYENRHLFHDHYVPFYHSLLDYCGTETIYNPDSSNTCQPTYMKNVSPSHVLADLDIIYPGYDMSSSLLEHSQTANTSTTSFNSNRVVSNAAGGSKPSDTNDDICHDVLTVHRTQHDVYRKHRTDEPRKKPLLNKLSFVVSLYQLVIGVNHTEKFFDSAIEAPEPIVIPRFDVLSADAVKRYGPHDENEHTMSDHPHTSTRTGCGLCKKRGQSSKAYHNPNQMSMMDSGMVDQSGGSNSSSKEEYGPVRSHFSHHNPEEIRASNPLSHTIDHHHIGPPQHMHHHHQHHGHHDDDDDYNDYIPSCHAKEIEYADNAISCISGCYPSEIGKYSICVTPIAHSLSSSSPVATTGDTIFPSNDDDDDDEGLGQMNGSPHQQTPSPSLSSSSSQTPPSPLQQPSLPPTIGGVPLLSRSHSTPLSNEMKQTSTLSDLSFYSNLLSCVFAPLTITPRKDIAQRPILPSDQPQTLAGLGVAPPTALSLASSHHYPGGSHIDPTATPNSGQISSIIPKSLVTPTKRKFMEPLVLPSTPTIASSHDIPTKANSSSSSQDVPRTPKLVAKQTNGSFLSGTTNHTRSPTKTDKILHDTETSSPPPRTSPTTPLSTGHSIFVLNPIPVLSPQRCRELGILATAMGKDEQDTMSSEETNGADASYDGKGAAGKPDLSTHGPEDGNAEALHTAAHRTGAGLGSGSSTPSYHSNPSSSPSPSPSTPVSTTSDYSIFEPYGKGYTPVTNFQIDEDGTLFYTPLPTKTSNHLHIFHTSPPHNTQGQSAPLSQSLPQNIMPFARALGILGPESPVMQIKTNHGEGEDVTSSTGDRSHVTSSAESLRPSTTTTLLRRKKKKQSSKMSSSRAATQEECKLQAKRTRTTQYTASFTFKSDRSRKHLDVTSDNQSPYDFDYDRVPTKVLINNFLNLWLD